MQSKLKVYTPKQFTNEHGQTVQAPSKINIGVQNLDTGKGLVEGEELIVKVKFPFKIYEKPFHHLSGIFEWLNAPEDYEKYKTKHNNFVFNKSYNPDYPNAAKDFLAMEAGKTYRFYVGRTEAFTAANGEEVPTRRKIFVAPHVSQGGRLEPDENRDTPTEDKYSSKTSEKPVSNSAPKDTPLDDIPF